MGFLEPAACCLLVLLGLLLVIALIWFLVALRFARKMVKPRLHDLNETRQKVIESGEASLKVVDQFVPATITTRDGYSLSAYCWSPETASGQRHTIILCHGHTWTWHGMLKYLGPFLDGTWNILLYDSRGHGGNARHPPTFGQLEARDLADVMVWSQRRFPGSALTGVYGESMGAAVILQALGSGLKADFAICDCAFSDLEELSVIQMRRAGIPASLVPGVLWLSRQLIRCFAGFDLGWIKPAAAIAHSRVPLLVMHGAKDGLAPVFMAHNIAKAAPGLVRLEIFPEGYHATSWASDSQHYESVVKEFLDTQTGQWSPH